MRFVNSVINDFESKEHDPMIPNYLFTGAFSSLRQLLATETPLKMMKNPFYCALKPLLVLKTFKFLS